MEKRKNPEKDLRKQSGLFFQIGLLAALMLAVCAFEYRTVEIINPVDISTSNTLMEPLMPVTIQTPPPPPPKPKIINPVETIEPQPEALPPDVFIDPEVYVKVEPEPLPEPLPVEIAPEYHEYVEQMPAPVGGYEAFYTFIAKNMKYSPHARRIGIEGRVYVQFIVDENGKITAVKAIKGVGAGLDEEAERVLSLSPDWLPGRQGGRKVKVRMIIPITFKLSD